MIVSPQKNNRLHDDRFNESVEIVGQYSLTEKINDVVEVSIIQGQALSIVKKTLLIPDDSALGTLHICVEKTNIGRQIFINSAHHQYSNTLNILLLKWNVLLLFFVNKNYTYVEIISALYIFNVFI